MEHIWNQGAALAFSKALGLSYIDEVYTKIAVLWELFAGKKEGDTVHITVEAWEVAGALVFATTRAYALSQGQPVPIANHEAALDVIMQDNGAIAKALLAVTESLPKPRQTEGEASA